jgi:flagellar hook assembly protein FlgD
VRLSIYDLSGQRVAKLLDRAEEAGRREIEWDGTDTTGQRLPAGLYWMELVAGAERRVERMVRLGR